jgi:DNA-binding response OmpR family regulator
MKRILIVEDDKKIAELERDYLEANNYEVDIALTGDDGLKMALLHEYNLIILDIMLPFTDGFKVCREVSQKKDIPILLVSAKGENIDKIKGFGLGAADYIVKPFEPSELVARVNAHIKRYDRLVSNHLDKKEEIVIGKLRIEKNSRRVFVDNQEISLPNKEFDVLLFLAENPNIVFSKDKLFYSIWGFDSYGDHSTVAVHINRIREKIETDSSNPQYIETVWGVGYRFKV